MAAISATAKIHARRLEELADAFDREDYIDSDGFYVDIRDFSTSDSKFISQGLRLAARALQEGAVTP